MAARGRSFVVDGPAFAVLVGLPLIAGLVLGTNQTRAGAFMPWLASIGYWITLSFVTWWLIAAGTWVARRVLSPWHPPQWAIWLIGGIAGSIVARPSIYAVTDIFRPLMHEPVLRSMRPWSFDLDFLAHYLTNWSLILCLWVAVCALADRWRSWFPLETAKSGDDASDAAPQPALLTRLPPALGRNVVALKAEDHYTRVYTDRGDALLLIGLSGAIADMTAGGVAGVRTHRSWWVAADAVETAFQRGRHAFVRLHNGVEVPVSVTYRQAVIAQGLSRPEAA
jgi:hypothetical protein